MDDRQRQQIRQRENREALGRAFKAWKDLELYLTNVPAVEDAHLEEFLTLNNRFLEAVDGLSAQSKDAFERRVSTSDVADRFVRLAKASIAGHHRL